MTGARWFRAQTSRLKSMISRIGEVATTEAVRKPPIATSGGADQSGGEISTAISPTTSPAPIVRTVSPLMTTSAVPVSMAYSEYPTPPSAASTCPGGISSADATLATAASSSSGKSAKKRIAASRNASIWPDYTGGSCLGELAQPLGGRLRDDVVGEGAHARFRSGQVLELARRAPAGEQLQVQRELVPAVADRRLVPGGDIRGRAAEQPVEPAKQVEVKLAELGPGRVREGGQVGHALARVQVNLVGPVRGVGHERRPVPALEHDPARVRVLGRQEIVE